MKSIKLFNDEARKYFSEKEQIKRDDLINLMNDWKQEISFCKPIIYYDDNLPYKTIEYFGTDGFLPGYYTQEQKVLFIGRESRANAGNDSVLGIINQFINEKEFRASNFWRRILYIVYAIKTKGIYHFDEIPYAVDIAKNMAHTNNYGFALMNISKYSNDRSDGGKADIKLINQFLEDSKLEKRNFIMEEIELLDPDIIITANLWDGKIQQKYLDMCFTNMQLVKSIEDKANYWILKKEKKEIKLLDLWHFSKPGNDKMYYYDPIIELLYK